MPFLRCPRRWRPLAVLALLVAMAGSGRLAHPQGGLGQSLTADSGGPAAGPGRTQRFTTASPTAADPDQPAVMPPSADPDQPAVMPPTHTVTVGETLTTVAVRYGVPVAALARANALRNRHVLHPGRTLVLPRVHTARPGTPQAAVRADLPQGRLLENAATRFRIDPALVKAVAWRESRWTQRVVSSQGAIGVMQVRPTTGEVVAAQLGGGLNLYDIEDNVTAGVAYLQALLQRTGGDVDAALAAYHQGPRSVAEQGRLPLTERYITDVLATRARFATHDRTDARGRATPPAPAGDRAG